MFIYAVSISSLSQVYVYKDAQARKPWVMQLKTANIGEAKADFANESVIEECSCF